MNNMKGKGKGKQLGGGANASPPSDNSFNRVVSLTDTEHD